jgi:sporulation protein YqfC
MICAVGDDFSARGIKFPDGGGVMDLREEIAERFDLPAETAGVVKVTLVGRRRLLVENHRGILEYAADHIAVSGGKIRVNIIGSGLELCAMDRDALLVTGMIASLELE